MCGLVGAVLSQPKLTEERIAAALASIAHRGPDNTTFWFSADRRLALGHVRLSIIGLDNGNQPLANATGDVHCVVNGELYGYKAIRARLLAEGRKFSTDTDSEIALHLYEQRGTDFVHDLRGEFAIVIADERRRCLIAVRDRFGIKPLYYAIVGDDLYLASEVKALIALGVPARWDTKGFLAHSFRTSQTIFAGIRAVPPGCLLEARNGRIEIRRYWDTVYPTKEALAADRRNDADVAAELRTVLDDAVAERLVSDVEVACYLSGGIDSCAVLGLAQRHLGRPIRAFTVTFDDSRYNEEGLARQTAAFAGAEFIPVPVTQQQITDSFSDALWHTECPMTNGNGAAKFLLSKAVRAAGIKVVFTGEGSDEIFAGYLPSRHDLMRHGADGGNPAALAELEGANPVSRGASASTANGLDIFQTELGFVPSWIKSACAFQDAMRQLLRAHLREEPGLANPYAEMLGTIDVAGRLRDRDPVNQSLYLWSHSVLANTILTYLADRMEMAHSIEGRVPFLDHHVTEYVAELPIRHKIRGRRQKHALREAVRDVVIPEVYLREKHPFRSPPGTDTLLAFCQDVLRSSLLREQPFFEPTRVVTILDLVTARGPGALAAFEPLLLLIVSTCILQQRFGLSTS